VNSYGDHSPSIVKFPDIFLTLCDTPTHVPLSTPCVIVSKMLVIVH